MKFLIVFALAFATVSAKDLYPRSVEVPVLENEGRIINGKAATLEEVKYQVGISLTKGIGVKWCGGSLIGKNWILSAAHCTNGALWGTVFLGSTKRRAAEKKYDVKKEHIITHPDFNPQTDFNDISLIKIPTTFESSRIRIVRFASNSDKYVGNVVVVSGWGATSDTDTSLPDNLQYGMLKVSPDSDCSFYVDFNASTNICVATANGASTCSGDSGAPLVLEIHNLQIGVLSFGYKLCTMGYPDVYTSVGHYESWIKSITGITGVSKL